MAKYFPTYQSSLDVFQQWRVAQQRLLKPAEPDVVRLLPQIGWLSPANAKLALFHREQGKAVADYERAVADRQVVRVRSVRGAYFMVERSMAPFAVAASQQPLAKKWRGAWTAAEVSDKQRQDWQDAILAALGTKELARTSLRGAVPAKLRDALPPAAAKRTGHEDYFGWLLAEMEEAGLVHLDEYTAARFTVRFPHVPAPETLDRKEALYKVAERYFLWGNAANPEDLAAWLGLQPRQAEDLMFSGDLPLSNLVLTGGNSRGLMIHSTLWESLRIFKPQREGPVFFVTGRDPLYGHNPEFLRRTVEPKAAEAIFANETSLRPLVLENGRVVGVWSPGPGKLEWSPTGRMTPPLRKKIEAVADRLSTWLHENPAAE